MCQNFSILKHTSTLLPGCGHTNLQQFPTYQNLTFPLIYQFYYDTVLCAYYVRDCKN